MTECLTEVSGDWESVPCWESLSFPWLAFLGWFLAFRLVWVLATASEASAFARSAGLLSSVLDSSLELLWWLSRLSWRGLSCGAVLRSVCHSGAASGVALTPTPVGLGSRDARWSADVDGDFASGVGAPVANSSRVAASALVSAAARDGFS